MLPPERNEDIKVRSVHVAGRFDSAEGGGGARDSRSDGGAVGREGFVLGAAGVGDLGAAPGGGAGGAGLHDEVDALPQAVDVDAAELVAIVEAAFHFVPVVTELEEEGAPAGGLDEGAAGGGFCAGATPREGEGETTLCGVEVRAFGQVEEDLVFEGGVDCWVVERARCGVMAGRLELLALVHGKMGADIEGVIRIRRQDVDQPYVHHQPLAERRG